jgi:hypothetical protein
MTHYDFVEFPVSSISLIVFFKIKLCYMARQTGTIVFEGTIGNLTGYQMNGRHYLKMKSSVSRKRILREDRFVNTRRNANWFGQAQKIAKQIYHELPPDQRDQYRTWYPLRNKAQLLLRKGLPHKEIIHLLRCEFITPAKQPNQPHVTRPIKEKQSASAKEIVDDILLGREINKGVEFSLVDQLAAARGFIQTLLSARTGINRMTTHLRSQKMRKTLEKFR